MFIAERQVRKSIETYLLAMEGMQRGLKILLIWNYTQGGFSTELFLRYSGLMERKCHVRFGILASPAAYFMTFKLR